MTCIIAIASEGKVYMGGERAHSDSHVIVSSTRPKIFDRGSYLIGYAGNSGIGQAVVHNFEFPPIPKNVHMDRHMTTVFIPALRSFIKDNDIKLSESDEDNASFIVGARGKVYEIDLSDYQCIEYDEVCIGSGSGYAYGSLHTTSDYDIDPIARIHIALDAAITYSPTCQGPIDYLEK